MQKLLEEIVNYKMDQRFYTIKDIVEKFGVSAITARRVLDELQKAGWVKKIPKRGTIVKRTNTPLAMKIIITDGQRLDNFVSQPVVLRIYSGLLNKTRDLNIHFEAVSESFIYNMAFQNKQRLGFFVIQHGGEKLLSFLASARLPAVILNASAKKDDILSLRIDLRAGTFNAVSYLTNKGHRRIAFLSGPITNEWYLPRFKGYVKALRKAHLPFDWALVQEMSAANVAENEDLFEQLWSLPDRPTAIFACSDQRAVQVLDWCKRSKIKVPDDLSVMGFDNMPESATTRPALTTVDICLEKMGALGVEALAALIMNGKESRAGDVIIKPQLVERESVRLIK